MRGVLTCRHGAAVDVIADVQLTSKCPTTTKPCSSDLPCHRHLSARRGPEPENAPPRLNPAAQICHVTATSAHAGGLSLSALQTGQALRPCRVLDAIRAASSSCNTGHFPEAASTSARRRELNGWSSLIALECSCPAALAVCSAALCAGR